MLVLKAEALAFVACIVTGSSTRTLFDFWQLTQTLCAAVYRLCKIEVIIREYLLNRLLQGLSTCKMFERMLGVWGH